MYGNNVYSVVKRYDNISKSFKSTYYYWVKNKKTTPRIGARSISASGVASLISNPRGEGYPHIALTSENSFSLFNVQPLLNHKDVVLSIEFWINDSHEQNIHSQWKLISSSGRNTIPTRIEQKWFDSLSGKDSAGRLVPDPELPPKLFKPTVYTS